MIREFFDALARGDIEALARCYHPEISFGDPVYLELEGRERVVGMWRMLLESSAELQVAARDITADNHSGAAHWTARYVLQHNGRRVVSEVDAQFRFEDGLIIRHHDDFDFRHWSKMALGRPTGVLVGWTPALRRRVRDRARRQLDEYLRSDSPISG
ncbi:nuclear transport factor 2 family protein [Sphaerisporangium perillae]|uniref:nuclear transport factor 2 family protein n=1 Tax=Sphaerisporangium perillae TaxID=2935860 RepID=UPI0020102AED|nr:nuclear transport factor 2 family protein [Sphaerisporangium perillae]